MKSKKVTEMEAAIIVAKAMCQLLIVLLAGVVLTKTGTLTADRTKGLSELIMNMLLPCMIAGSFFNANNPETLSNFMTAFWLSLIANAVSVVVGYLLIRGKNSVDLPIERSTAMFPNVGFIGLPLAQMLFQEEGALYIAAYVATYNMVQWTLGELIMGKFDRKEFLKTLRSPLLIASYIGLAVFFFHIPVPQIIVGGVKYISNSVICISMFVVANKFCESDFRSLLKSGRAYYIYFIKLIIIPIVYIFIARAIGAPEKVALSLLMGVAAPTAMAVTMLSVKYERDAGYAAGLLSMTNLLCMVTIPLITLLYSVL